MRTLRSSLVSILALSALTLSPLSAEVSGVELRLLASGLADPVAIAQAGDDRLFIVEQGGRIRIFSDGALASGAFLDISGRVRSGGEQGLLGLAFHPRYAENGFLFVNYTREGDGATVVSRFRRSSSDPQRADPGSEAILLTVAQPFDNHNGGDLAFGADGYLYIGMGDGGAGGDPDCRSQNHNQLLGKMLRLDVDSHATSAPWYSSPADNPFAGTTGADEIWALGLRNPWRFSFDRTNGDLFVADVGQSERDEVDLWPAAGGGGANFGWKIMEGSACYSRDACAASAPACGSAELALPILENLLADANCAVIGGYRYRGHRLPALEGRYLFGDYCSGRLWAAATNGTAWTRESFPFELPGLTTFGETQVGEIVLATQAGELYALERPQLGSCIPGAGRVCLVDGRFQVEVSFRDYAGHRGDALPVLVGSDSALLWFFAPATWEHLVKLIDGCSLNGHWWVYGAAATDVEYVLRVTDTVSHEVREYRNSLGNRAAALTDSAAFATCP
ncbi:MAG: PQQ-dependent sugar dehydrogenase [Thermoanaerobaculia bacterium]